MDVTLQNFDWALHQFGALLPHADFCAFDCEFTGLAASDAPESRDHWCDHPEERWKRAQQAAKQFLPLQVGLCLFTRQVVMASPTQQHEQWVAHPFNFFLFPQDATRFLVQASSLQFLVKHGFSLNRCIGQGIGWMPRDQEADLRAAFSAESRRQVDAFSHDGTMPLGGCSGNAEPAVCNGLGFGNDSTLMTDRDQTFVDNLETDLARWTSYRNAMPSDELQAATSTVQSLPFPACSQYTILTVQSITISTWVPFHRQLVAQIVASKYPRLIVESSLEGGSTTTSSSSSSPSSSPSFHNAGYAVPPLIISHPTEEERQTKFHQQMTRERMQFDKNIQQRVGFRRVMDLLAASRVPLVGYSALLDLTYVLQHFDTSPPEDETFVQWCARVHSRFPLVFDTKRIAQEPQYQLGDKSGLTQSLMRMNAVPCPYYTPICSAPNYSRYDMLYQQRQLPAPEHEAGYDAYLTGQLFLRLSQVSAANGMFPFGTSTRAATSLTDESTPTVSWCPPSFQRAFANRLFLWQSPMEVVLSPSPLHQPVPETLRWTCVVQLDPPLTQQRDIVRRLQVWARQTSGNESLGVMVHPDGRRAFLSCNNSKEQQALIISAPGTEMSFQATALFPAGTV